MPRSRAALRHAARRNRIRGIVTGCVEGWTVLAGTLAFAVVRWARLCATRTEPVHRHLESFDALRRRHRSTSTRNTGTLK